MSNLTSASNEASASASSINRNDNNMHQPQYFQNQTQLQPVKKKRNQPGHPDPSAEVIALSPTTLMATNRFVCEICNKGFQRDQNLQLHRRGHNLPWKLKQRTSKEIRKKVYVCPESSCVHHEPSRALGDLTGIKKHFCRKHGEKKWKCDKCLKKYAVQSDWKAHSKTCGTKEYRCDCGTLFSRRDSFITHRAFCDALAEESARSIPGNNSTPLQATSSSFSPLISHQLNAQSQFNQGNFPFPIKKEQQNFSTLRQDIPPWLACSPIIGPGPGPQHINLTTTTTPSSLFQDFSQNQNPNPNPSKITETTLGPPTLPPYHHHPPSSPHISATALLQKATQMGAKSSNSNTTQCASPAGMFSGPHHTHVSDSDHISTTGFGLNLSSRDEFINGLASYGNKAVAVAGGGSQTGGNSNSPSSLLHDMMMNSPHPLSCGYEGSPFEDFAFDNGNMVNNSISKKSDEGMTRDFLGLKPLFHRDILNITSLSNCMNRNSDNACNDQDQDQAQNSWQG